MKVNSIVIFQESRIPFFCMKKPDIARLRKAFPTAKVTWCHTKLSLLKVLPQAQVVVSWAFRQAWFAHAPKLRRLVNPSAGRDLFPITPPPRVKVRYGTHHGAIMAETVIGLMLAFERGLFDAYRLQLQGDLWPDEVLFGLKQLSGKHAVIVGFGHIGQKIGELLKPFGVRVTGVRRDVSHPRPAWFCDGDCVEAVTRLDAVLPKADHVILVLPSDTGTDRLFDARRLKRLSKHAVLYNVGRGNCVDENALAEALKSGALRGACIDVFAREPLTADSPLAQNLPGLVRLPHAAAFSDQYMDRFIDDVIAWLNK